MRADGWKGFIKKRAGERELPELRASGRQTKNTLPLYIGRTEALYIGTGGVLSLILYIGEGGREISKNIFFHIRRFVVISFTLISYYGIIYNGGVEPQR